MFNLKRLATYTFLGLVTFVSIFPFYWMISGATNESVDVIKGKLTPGSYLLQNFKKLITTLDLIPALYNSVVISVTTTLFALLITSLAGYAFEIFRSRAKDLVFNILLLSMMIPFSALMVPLFRFFAKVSYTIPIIGVDTKMAVIFPTMATAFLIFFFRQSTKMFPIEMLEAGRIDGLSEFGLFFKIFMPTMKTTYAAAGIITFMMSWNNYLWPLVVLQSPENLTIPLLISTLGSSYSPDYGMITLAVVIATLPTALVFFLMQRHFVEGMIGSVK